jgi:hypothetical protein
MASGQYPCLRSFTWFDVNKEEDYRIFNSAAGKQAFSAGLQASGYQGTTGAGLAKIAP